MSKKDYDSLKRQLKKKRIIVDGVKQVIPMLEEQLRDKQLLLRTLQDERENKSKEIQKLKEDIDAHIAHFLQLEEVEADKKQVNSNRKIYFCKSHRRMILFKSFVLACTGSGGGYC